MLVLPNAGSSCATLIGIDPGSTSVGISIMNADVVHEQILATYAHTLHLDRMGGNDWLGVLHGDRFKRIAVLKQYLINLFFQTQPLCISAESPFFNMLRPQAYGVLMEVMAAIREAVMTYDTYQELYLIDPSSVKNAVGASGGAKKDVVQMCVLGLQDLNPVVDMNFLDEHSIDSIAVNYTRFKRIFGRV